MISPLDVLSLLLATAGTFFFFAGAVGLVRLPDVYSRLHALSKADNLGLGFIVVASMLQAESALQVVKLGLVWLLILIASSSLCVLIARAAYQESVPGHPEEQA